MHKFILKKVLQMIPMLLIISFLIFFSLELTPMDPIKYLVSPDLAANNADNIEALRESLGLNDPFLVRYFRWLGDLLRGELGYSLVNGGDLKTIIAASLPSTFELALVSMLISTVLGIGLGIITAVKQNGFIDNATRFFAVLGTSLPTFFFGIILIYVFAIELKWFPIGGRISNNYSHLMHLFLPALTMSIGLTPAVMRYTRNSMLDVFNSDYVKTARAKGIPEWKVYTKHILRNSLLPVLILLIFRLPSLISGAVTLEAVFSWPGIGRVIVNGVNSGDYPVIMVTTLMVSVAILLSSLLVDVVSAYLDPRIRLDD
ncbi:peptide/nickel transport system permease protein [Streptococcus rupicaprae]|uniref:Peptide/nickel transport system permease protein n=1 Tax=Streptococcus rupicaprae TaxID=759619 RepID=A0ABV2FGG1_9STRE